MIRLLASLIAVLGLTLLSSGPAAAANDPKPRYFCDKHPYTTTPSVIQFGGGPKVSLKLVRFACYSKRGTRPPSQVGGKSGLQDARGKWLIPQRYNTILPLSSAHSLVQLKSVDGKPSRDEGWYVYMHGKGPGPRLSYSRFHRLVGGSGDLDVYVGENDDAPRTASPRKVGVITSVITSVRPLQVYGVTVNPGFASQGTVDDYERARRGDRWAVERYGETAIVVHLSPTESQMMSMAVEPISPIMNRIDLFGRGRDAVVGLLQIKHPDMPPEDTGRDVILGRSVSILYLPLDPNGSVAALPEGAIGVMIIPGDTSLGVTATGWAVVYPKGEGFEFGIGSGSLQGVIANAAGLPRYAGLHINGRYVLVKEPRTGYWNVYADTIKMEVAGETSERRPENAIRVYRARSDAKQAADRQLAAQRRAEAEAERQRLQREAAARAAADRQRLIAIFDRNPCDQRVRSSVISLGDSYVKRYFESCGMYGSDDFARAERVGVDRNLIERARSDYLWKSQQEAAARQRDNSVAAITGASSNWGPVSTKPIGAEYGTYGAEQQRYVWDRELAKQLRIR
ncbi:MAG: hypothetical protein KF842_00550 [Caulobacter sp.]|nr:hypothetical protein [Caulobacter sp.]